MDRSASRKLIRQTGYLWLMILLVGCSESPWSKVSSFHFNPFRKSPTANSEYGPIPAQQIAELKKLASEGKKMTAQQQQRVSAELALRVQNEVDPTIRTQLVRTIGAFPTMSSAEVLQIALNDNEADVRIAACDSWRQLGGPRAMNALAEVLASDTDVDVRIAAAKGLGDFKDATSFNALALALEDSDPALQYRAVQSLRTATGRDYGNDLDAWKQFAEGGNPPAPETPSLVERMRNWF